MLDTLFNRESIWVIGPGLFLLLCLAAEAGYRLQQGLDRRSPPGVDKIGGAGHILAISLGLLSLLLGFTFSIAINRYDTRRALVLEEANAIGTTYLRAELMAEPARTALLGPLREYTQARIDFYEAGDDEARLAEVERRTNALQSRLWDATGQAIRTMPNNNLTTALLEVMNNSFDQAPARKVAMNAHIPAAILFGLTVQMIASAVMLGAVLGGNGRRHPLLAVMLLALLAYTLVLIIDIDRPRQNNVLINQEALLDLRAALQAESAQPNSSPSGGGGSP